jgi:hypothetical protein
MKRVQADRRARQPPLPYLYDLEMWNAGVMRDCLSNTRDQFASVARFANRIRNPRAARS